VPNFLIAWVRSSFPALNSGDNFIFFDNGTGAQVPQVVLDAVQNHLLMRHAQRDGRYGRSKEVMPSSSARNFNLEPDGKRFAATNHPHSARKTLSRKTTDSLPCSTPSTSSATSPSCEQMTP